MNIDTVSLPYILKTDGFVSLNHFLTHAAFVVSHKSESIKTLLDVLWYLPVDSPIIVVTNCPTHTFAEIKRDLQEHLTHKSRIYLVHQKDGAIASFFRACAVHQILGPDGKVVDGKGEGMYIGTLCAFLLGSPQWVIFYDADNLVPGALLEYTLAMGRLFLSTPAASYMYENSEAPMEGRREQSRLALDLHNIRVCWASKPEPGGRNLHEKVLGRCTRVVSPLFSSLLEERFGMCNYAVYSSNAGEQGMTIKTACALHFSSGFSVETFQLLDFLSKAAGRRTRSAVLQQYQSKSPHFHEKKGEEHIKRLIEESLGSFFLFGKFLSHKVRHQLQQIYRDHDLQLIYPVVYPALQDLHVLADETFVNRYKLIPEKHNYDVLPTNEEVSCVS